MCYGHYPYHSDSLSDEEVELVGGFIGNVKDWADLADDLEPIDTLRADKSLSYEIQELKEKNFRVFCAREKQQMRGGISAPSNFYVVHIAVVRETDAMIVPLPEHEERA